MKYQIFYESAGAYFAAIQLDDKKLKERLDCLLLSKENKGFGLYTVTNDYFFQGIKKYNRISLRGGVTKRALVIEYLQEAEAKLTHYLPRLIPIREKTDDFLAQKETDIWISLIPRPEYEFSNDETHYQIIFKIIKTIEKLEQAYREPPCGKCIHGFSLQILNNEHLKCSNLYTSRTINPNTKIKDIVYLDYRLDREVF